MLQEENVCLERRLETGLVDIYATLGPGFQNVFRITKAGFEWLHRHTLYFAYLCELWKRRTTSLKIKLVWLFTCLLPTIIFQTALAKAVLEIQFSKLGLIPPEGNIPHNIRNTFQLLWANNGDIISKQYAGTNALKVHNANFFSLQYYNYFYN